MSYNLIVPVAAHKNDYDSKIPPLFRLDESGFSYCVKAIMGLNYKVFDHIYFSVLAEHERLYGICELLEIQFKRMHLDNAKVTILPAETKSQPETIYNTLLQENVTGAFMVKDADSYFEMDAKPENAVAIYPLSALNWVNPQCKSYVAVDDMYYIVNIIEKRIIGQYFSAGAYGFDNAAQFVQAYERLSQIHNRLYLSHIIYAMLLDKISFRPNKVSHYIDFENEKL